MRCAERDGGLWAEVDALSATAACRLADNGLRRQTNSGTESNGKFGTCIFAGAAYDAGFDEAGVADDGDRPGKELTQK